VEEDNQENLENLENLENQEKVSLNKETKHHVQRATTVENLDISQEIAIITLNNKEEDPTKKCVSIAEKKAIWQRIAGINRTATVFDVERRDIWLVTAM
jgi:hypothetical protein